MDKNIEKIIDFISESDGFCDYRICNKWFLLSIQPEFINVICFNPGRKTAGMSDLFTLNIGLISTTLAKKQIKNGQLSNRYLSSFSLSICHLNIRIGSLMPIQTDIWWSVKDEREIEEAKDEVLKSLTQYAIPYLSQFRTTSDLASLWEKGIGPGLSAFQIDKYLSLLSE